jgi:glyoxylase-like metal-dependent hydrolase (beta-lactamase superfamily II)
VIVEHFSVAPLGCNCVILGDEVTRKAIVVDPGGEVPRILRRLTELDLVCAAIIHTHAHFDHVGGTSALQKATSAPTMLHEGDLFLFENMQMQLDSFGVPLKAPEPCEIDRFLGNDDVVAAGELSAGVLHTPGHTPGSLCFHVAGDKPLVIAGDTLFRGSIGRTDLWGGDGAQIIESIEQRLLTLPDDTLVITGHGPTTTIGAERRFNPFLA